MSLVSAKNFVAPLSNKVHLITIVLIAISFAVLRLMGASLSIQPTSRTEAPVQQPALKQEVARPHNDAPLFSNSETRPVSPWGKKQKTEKKQARTPRTAPATPPSNSGGLDDIEKALGM